MTIKRNNRKRIFHPSSRNNSQKSLYDLIKDYLPVLTTFLGFIFGSLTAYIGFRSDTQLQNQSYILELRQSAYNNFSSSQAKLQESDRLADSGFAAEATKLRQEYNLEIRTARFQLAIFGTKPVIDALVHHFRTSHGFDRTCTGDPQVWQNNAQIYQNMRQEVFGNDNEQKVDDKTLVALLFGCTPP